MELLRGGQTLAEIGSRYHSAGRFPPPGLVIDYMRQFFVALDAAHSAGVLHRDIKGANVMVEGGIVRVMDFGMGAYLSQPGAVLQTTLSIFAPENFDGRFTAASDIYQAGLMFYQFSTGIEPFATRPGPTDPAAERHRRTMWRYRPCREIPGVRTTGLLDDVLGRCLAYGEAARLGSARAVLLALVDAEPCVRVDRALASGDWQVAARAAEAWLTDGSLTDEDRLAALSAAAQALAACGDTDAALEHYRDAVALAEASGVALRRPQDFNTLVQAVEVLYLKRGQPGMARLFAKKRR
jgi:serine/threonine-protein kinase